MSGAGRRRVVRTVKLAIGAVVIAAVGWHVAAIGRDLAARGASLRLDPAWLAASVAAYVAALLVAGLWFHRVMGAGPTPIGRGPAVRSYVVSHLGKYVPGKAMVVVVRASLAASAGARTAAAVFATLYETLVMMAAGAVMATLGYAASPTRAVAVKLGPLGERTMSLLGLSVPLAALFLVVTAPGIFPRLAAAASASLRGVGAGACPRLGARLLLEGLGWNAIVWLLLGASQFAVLRALGVTGLGWGEAPAIVAGVALATVAGFVIAVAPGGLGVREWVLWTSLGVVLDHERAVLAALVLRMSWLIGELAAAGVCGLLGRLAGRDRGSAAPRPPGVGPSGNP